MGRTGKRGMGFREANYKQIADTARMATVVEVGI